MKMVNLKPFLSGHGPDRKKTTLIVLHDTGGGTAEGAIETLRERGLSYHYLIEPDGNIIKCLPVGKVGYHAGESVGPNKEVYCNRYSIGVSFVNKGEKAHPVTEAQLEAAVWLCKELKTAYPTIAAVTTHYGVSFPRKVDPEFVDAAHIAKEAGIPYWKGRRSW